MRRSLNLFRQLSSCFSRRAAALVLPFALMQPVMAATENVSSAKAEEPSVVLVHGAFSDGSAWHRVIPILQKAGVAVSAAQLGLASLQSDAATVTRLIDQHSGPVVLVGHSYGGSVITEAGAHDKVSHLVYVAGFALDQGQSLAALTQDKPPAPWQAEIYPDAMGYLRLTDEGMLQFFAQDLPPSEAAVLAATQRPIKYATNRDAPSVAAWSQKPTSYVIAAQDRILSPKVQGYFARKMQAEITTVEASHVVMLSQPEAVAGVILSAVEELAASNNQ